MGIQDGAITEVLNLAKRQQAANESMLPLQREAMQFGLESQRTAYQQSQADREWLLGRRGSLTDLQDQMVSEARDFNSGAQQAQMVATAQADAGAAMSNLRQARDRELASMGVAPGSGRAASVDRLDEARILAGATNQARTQARTEGRMLTDRAANFLAGYPAQATAATGQAAGFGANTVGVANAGAAGVNAAYGQMTGAQQAASGIAGQMGSNATSMFGTQANYKLGADQAAADTSLIGGVGTLLGGAAQAYTAFSAREYKVDVQRIGDHPRLPGVGLYSFRYRDDLRQRMGDATYVGVMADEVAAVRPDAVGVDADGFTVVDYSKLH